MVTIVPDEVKPIEKRPEQTHGFQPAVQRAVEEASAGGGRL
jgi:hypothetical protein